MTGVNVVVPVQLCQTAQGCHNFLRISGWKIGAPHRPAEQRIAGKKAIPAQKATASLCVSGRVQDGKLAFAQSKGIAVRQQNIRSEGRYPST